MRKYKFYNSKGKNIIFTKGMDIISMNIDKLAMEMRENGRAEEIGLGILIFFGDDVQKFKAVNSFPEVLEDFINRINK